MRPAMDSTDATTKAVVLGLSLVIIGAALLKYFGWFAFVQAVLLSPAVGGILRHGTSVMRGRTKATFQMRYRPLETEVGRKRIT